MKDTAFSRYHPVVNLLFFLGAIGCGSVLQHPAYLLWGLVCGSAWYLLLTGWQGVKRLLTLAALFCVIALLNPLLNTQGATVLFFLFGRPYTLQALVYGGVIGGICVNTLLWFGCCNGVLTREKWLYLLGGSLPALSLLLVMVLRLVSHLRGKNRQIIHARQGIGKHGAENFSQRLRSGAAVLSALSTWALEGGLVTADAMTSRGFGCGKRTHYQRYAMEKQDWLLLVLLLSLLGVTIGGAATGSVFVRFLPEITVASTGGIRRLYLICYCFYLLIPTALHIKEALVWRIFRSKISPSPTPVKKRP